MNKLIFWLGLFLIIFFSCEKENIDTEIDITLNDWKVIKIKKQGELSYLNAAESYIFEFINDTTFTFNLDVNSCGGQYKIISKGSIELGDTYCTEICCDSDFAEDLRQLIPQMTRYYGKGNELIFKGQGEIILGKF
ncbi:hypothetical protein ES708_13596 [subsurface metagenome]